MKRKAPLTCFLFAFASLIAAGFAEEKPAPAAPKARVRVQVQGDAQLQVQGVEQLQLRLNDIRARVADMVDKNAALKLQLQQPPVIFFPGIPSILLPNPLAIADTRPGFLGVQLDTGGDAQADDEAAKKDAAKKITGVGIMTVIDDSPAAKAGLKDGDRVLTLDGREAKNSTQLREMIRAVKPEQEVKMTVRRDGKEMEIKAKLGAAPGEIAGVPMLQLNGAVPMFGGQNEPVAVPGVVTFPTGARRGIVSTFNGTTVIDGRSIANISRVSGGKDASDAPDSVLLRDGNRFTGKIRGIDPAKGLLLQREGLQDLELIEKEINGLTFAEREKGGDAAKAANVTSIPKVVLQLRDGSILHGDALTMERGTLLLTLPAGQRIEIPREHAQSATLSDGESAQIYEGPTALTGWSGGRYGEGKWEYKDGTLRCISNSPIGRDLGRLPDPLDVSFDVNFPWQMQHFGVSLFAAGVSESGVGTLTLNFSPDRISGSHYDGKRSNQYNAALEQNGPRVFSSKPETIGYRILVDRVQGNARIYINGVKRADWKLSRVKPEDLGKCGAMFSITPHASMSDVTFALGRVRILPWNGAEPTGPTEPADATGDQVLTSDGTTKGGTLDRITGTEILFAQPADKVRREKTVFVRFAEPATPKESPAATAIARLRNGSEISASQVHGTGETLTITTRSGPQITLPFAALRSLDFLPGAGQAVPSEKNLDVLTLTDGTQLSGRALVPFEGTNVNWKIAASNAPLEFPSEKIAGVLFRSTEAPRKSTPLKGDNAIRLGNGDWLPGEVVSLDSTRLVMKNDLAPEFTVPLSGLRAIYLNPDVAATLADGATGPDLWTDGWTPNRSALTGRSTEAATKAERSWKYFDGNYSLVGIPRAGQQTISKHWPAYVGAYALSFDTFTPSRTTYFNAQFYNSKDERTFSVSASGSRIYIYYTPVFSRQNRVVAPPKQIQIENKTEASGGVSRVTIVLDRPANTFRIRVGGKEVGKIAFKEDEAKAALDICGMTLTTSYYSSTSSRQGRIEHLWFAPWNGPPDTATNVTAKAGTEKAAEKEKAPAAEEAPKKDLAPEAKVSTAPTPVIYLANGDEFPGSIEKITPDLVTVNSDAGPLEFPAKRVAWIHFPGCSESIAGHFPRLRFHDRGLLSVNDLHIGSDHVACKTLDGQPLDFPLSVVKEVIWRPIADK